MAMFDLKAVSHSCNPHRLEVGDGNKLCYSSLFLVNKSDHLPTQPIIFAKFGVQSLHAAIGLGLGAVVSAHTTEESVGKRGRS